MERTWLRKYERVEGQIAKHTINAQVFMKNPVGVAEHPDTMATIEEELGKIAEYKDKLAALNSIGYDYPDHDHKASISINGRSLNGR